ncbi:MAG: aspartyl/asparaginyl beta-hydroxylase domain-containing protein [Xenococcaceae cyanobacterium MO_188.B29]|nr:aspartyl/asparaginyl beta-hydroxylase domain-containing protein [Xenococcaceae cyanobacterium MO_188.B29]
MTKLTITTIIKGVKTQLAAPANFIRIAQYLSEASKDKDLYPILRSYLGKMPLCIFSEPILALKMLLDADSRFQKSEQRPYAFYAPNLTAISFGKPDEISNYLEQNFQQIYDEFTTVAPPEISTPSKALVSEGTWNTFPLRRSSKLQTENISRCPQTWKIAEKCPLLEGVEGGVYFSIIYPGTHVRSHCGPSNIRYRYHLTIEEAENARIRSGSEWRSWQQGKCLILDDSFEHEVIHSGEKRRVVFIVDCWHPDLNKKEQEFLTRLHQIWRKPPRKVAEKKLEKVGVQAA